MSFWSRLVGRKSDNRSITSSLELFREVFGSRESRSGVTVTWQTALDVAAVLACVRVLANGVSQAPFRLYRADEEASRETRQKAPNHPISMVLRRPNPWQTGYEFKETLMFHLVLTGNAFAFKNRVGRDLALRELIPIEPARVEVEQLDDQRLVYHVRGERDGRRQTFPAETIWHLRGPSWNSWMGLEAVRMARDAIGLAMSLETNQSEFTEHGGKTSGMLSMEGPLSTERYNLLREWIKKTSESGDAYAPLILDNGMKYTPFTLPAVDQQLLETRNHQIEEICRAFGVMPIMVGYSDKAATYASAEQMFQAHVIHTLAPWYARIEQSADVNLLTPEERAEGYYTKFIPNALMRGAARDRAEFYAKALGSGGSAGWMTPNEIRALEEMDAIEGGDELPKPPNNPETPSPAPVE